MRLAFEKASGFNENGTDDHFYSPFNYSKVANLITINNLFALLMELNADAHSGSPFIFRTLIIPMLPIKVTTVHTYQNTGAINETLSSR